MAPTELDQLKAFLTDLDAAIVHAINRRQDLMPTHLHTPLGNLLPTYIARMSELRREVENASLRQRRALEDNGLTGPELNVKLAGFNANYTAFVNTKTDDSKVPGPSGRPTLRWLRPLKGVFNWANIILGSMTGIFGGKDAVEEIKKIIERGIEDGEDGDFTGGNMIFPHGQSPG